MFYGGKDDLSLQYDAVIKSGDIYVQRYEYASINKATLDLTTPSAAVLTLGDSVSFTDDAFNSTAKNLLLIDDTGKVCSTKIDDTLISGSDYKIIFDSGSLLREEDGVASSLTDTGTYSIQILSASVNEYGDFWGYVDGNSLEIDEEYAEYFYGVPKRLVYRDLTKKTFKVSGGSLMLASEDVSTALFNAVSYGVQTGGYSKAAGFSPTSKPRYRMSLVTEDRKGRGFVVVFRKGEFSLSGKVDFSGSEHKILPYSFNLFSDEFYPEDADALLIKRIDV